MLVASLDLYSTVCGRPPPYLQLLPPPPPQPLALYNAPIFDWSPEKERACVTQAINWGCLKRSARAVQLFRRPAVVETHNLWYFGHHCCLVVGFDALGIWHFWMFTLFHPFLPFCTHFLPISTTSTLFLG